MNERQTMTGDLSGGPAAANRVSIRAVLARDNEDVTEALARAGIVEPVAIPVQADPAEGFLGDGITPNLTGVLEPDETPVDDPDPNDGTERPPAGVRAQPATATLPPEYGMRAFAPVRKRNP
jgi:hypothetical protein